MIPVVIPVAVSHFSLGFSQGPTTHCLDLGEGQTAISQESQGSRWHGVSAKVLRGKLDRLRGRPSRLLTVGPRLHHNYSKIRNFRSGLSR